jgi:hypothetical protein
LPSDTQGGSRMPELGPYGFVRGAVSNDRPYRDSQRAYVDRSSLNNQHRRPIEHTRDAELFS